MGAGDCAPEMGVEERAPDVGRHRLVARGFAKRGGRADCSFYPRRLVGRWPGRDALVGVFAPVLNAGFEHFGHDAF